VDLIKISDFCWEIPAEKAMLVPGRIIASENMLENIVHDEALKQVVNVATLPGIVRYSLAMPDIHWGYGFPIGGVAAMDVETGVVSPGGVGYDINCGVRLLRSNLTEKEVEPHLKQLVDLIFKEVPCGVGSTGRINLQKRDLDDVLSQGSKWAVEHGYGFKNDLSFTEENGTMEPANPDAVSKRAKDRGHDQLGTLGSGNHFLEIQVVEKIYDTAAANKMGLFGGQIAAMIHCGSRGLGHQVCDEFEHDLVPMLPKFGFKLPDRQLACAPISSDIGKKYLEAMAASANFAWANRQIIMHWVRGAFESIFKKDAASLGLDLVYDVAHNIAKFEEHRVDMMLKKLLVHRKGATRAFPDQPVIIPGDMGRASYVLTGTQKAMDETFGSTCHGAGRLLSRTEAIKKMKDRKIDKELAQKGIYIKWNGRDTLCEEASEAYKDIADVVGSVVGSDISKKVAKLRPIGVIKG
jgi:tRNA-splicing ligase RtcB (3'-phosphate/5'-hydroxy nucleic acid ligase)